MRSQKGANNLYQGRNAVAYVKSKLRFGPANNPLKLQPDLEAQLKAMNAYLKVRKGEDEAMDSQFINPSDTLRVARAFAENAEKFGGATAGNMRRQHTSGCGARVCTRPIGCNSRTRTTPSC